MLFFALPKPTPVHSKKPLVCSQLRERRFKPPKIRRRPPSTPSLSERSYALTDELNELLGRNHIREAVTLLDEELKKNPDNPIPLASYRTLHEIIASCNTSRRWELALRTFHILEAFGYSISRRTSCILLKTLQRAGRIAEAEKILSSLWNSSVTLANGNSYTFDKYELNHRLPDEKLVTQVANSAVDSGKSAAAIRMLRLMERNGVPFTLFSTSVLFKAYGREGRPEMIRQALEDMRLAPDVIVLNSAIDAYVRCNELPAAMNLIRDMQNFELTPNARSYNPVMRHLAQFGKMNAAFSLYDEMMKRNIAPSARTVNALIHACVQAEDWKKARQLLAEAVEADPDPRTSVNKDLLVAYTTLISGLATQGDMRGAEELLARMVDSVSRTVNPRAFDADVGIALTAILSALLADDEFVRAWILFRSVRRKFKIRLPPDMYNAVIRGLSKRGDAISMEAAGRVFDEMMQVFRKSRGPKRRTDIDSRHGDPSNAAVEATPQDIARAYNAIIDGFVRLGDTASGEEFLDDMERNGHEPTVVSYTTLINGYGKEFDITSVRRMFKRMQRAGIAPDKVTMNAFLGACVRCGEIDLTVRVFEDMKRIGGKVAPNLVSFSAIIAGHLREGQREDAWKAYEEMKEMGIKPNERVLDRMMAAFVSPELRPDRATVWCDMDYEGERIEIVEDEDEDGVVELFTDDEEDVLYSNTVVEEDSRMQSLRKKIADEKGWASGKAIVLLDDMDKCNCSEISKERWRIALAKAWL